jgi:hypothetical protein
MTYFILFILFYDTNNKISGDRGVEGDGKKLTQQKKRRRGFQPPPNIFSNTSKPRRWEAHYPPYYWIE